jgi:preprotein translocase subunit SecE
MSRILRKKPVTQKRKSKRAEGEQAENGGPVADKDHVVAVPAEHDQTKKSAFITRKPPPPPPEPGSLKGYIHQASQFLREVKIELKKVAWPSRQQTVGSTAIVLVLVMVIALFLGAADIGLSGLIRVVLQ